MRQRIQQDALSHLIDGEEEIAEQELLEAKSNALQELLQPEGPSKSTLKFQKDQQPDKNLETVNLQDNERESMSPQRKLVISNFG